MFTFVHDLKITVRAVTGLVIFVSPKGSVIDFRPGTLKLSLIDFFCVGI